MALLGFTLALTGCTTVGPDYVDPVPAAPITWQAPSPHGGSVTALGNWWSQFNDPVLAQLQRAAEAGSPTLSSASASIDKARATLSSARASGWPSVTGQASATRGTQQTGEVASARSAGLDAAWELDLFGKVRRSTEAASARIQAREDDWHDARVSLAAEVADTYVQYRACGLLVQTYEQTLTSLGDTAKATESLAGAGLGPDADSSLARASLTSTVSTGLAQRAECDLLVKSLVNLTGMDEPGLRQQLDQGATAIPQIAGLDVQRVPADALRQRPDLASRERELAAASADIDVAQADLYPSLSLSGSIGVSATSVASLLRTWSFGPTLSIPIFDGGRTRAAIQGAQADYASAEANWRQSVRTVVKEVEQALVRLDAAAQRTEQAERAAQAYRRYLVGADAQWRAGTISLLTLEESRRQALSAQIELIGLQRDRVAYWIALYKALGGDWQRATPGSPSARTLALAPPKAQP